MTDYSGAIFALVAITSVLTAAVLFVLAQPTDLPVIKKIQGWTSPVPPELRLNNGHTRPSRSCHQLRHRLLRFEHLQDESSSTALDQWPFWHSIFKIECQNTAYELWLTWISLERQFKILIETIYWLPFKFCAISRTTFLILCFILFYLSSPWIACGNWSEADRLFAWGCRHRAKIAPEHGLLVWYGLLPLRLCSTAAVWLQDLPHCVIIAISTLGSPRRDRINQDLLQSTRRVPPRWCCLKRRVASC